MTTFPVAGAPAAPNQVDGAASSPWGAGAQTRVRVVSNRFCNDTSASTGEDAIATHGITATGNWQVSFWFNGTDVIAHGGCAIAMIGIGSGNGWGIFVGNAIHIRKFTAGVQGANLTNDARTDTGDIYVEWSNNETTGVRTVFINGVSWSTVTDTAFDGGDTVQVLVESDDYPTRNTMMWGLRIQDSINVLGAPPFIARPDNFSKTARMRAGNW